LTAPIKFLKWILGVALMIGVTDSFGQLTLQMAKVAIHAQQNDQVSWGRFSRMLWGNNSKLK